MGYLIIIATVCVAEMILRRLVHKHLKLNEKRKVKKLPIDLNRHHNYGMAGSRMKDRPETVKVIGIFVMSLLVILFCLTLPLRGKKTMKAGLALIVGGGLANLAERFIHGYVTDYVQFRVPIPRLQKLIFNVADFAIFIGSVLTVLGSCDK
jgi:signal peptidase II